MEITNEQLQAMMEQVANNAATMVMDRMYLDNENVTEQACADLNKEVNDMPSYFRKQVTLPGGEVITLNGRTFEDALENALKNIAPTNRRTAFSSVITRRNGLSCSISRGAARAG